MDDRKSKAEQAAIEAGRLRDDDGLGEVTISELRETDPRITSDGVRRSELSVSPQWQHVDASDDWLNVWEGDTDRFVQRVLTAANFSNRERVIAENLVNPTREWQEIAAEFGISKARMSQLRARIQARLRQTAKNLSAAG